MPKINIPKKVKLALLVIVSISAVILAVLLRANAPKPVSQNLPSPAPTIAAVPATGEWGSIDEVKAEFGEPIKKLDLKNGVEEYKIQDYKATNKITYIDGAAVFGREIITPKSPKTADSIKNKFGSAEIILYAPGSRETLFAYPTKGIAYIGVGEKPVLLEIWYFSPQDIISFRSTWAKTFENTPREESY